MGMKLPLATMFIPIAAVLTVTRIVVARRYTQLDIKPPLQSVDKAMVIFLFIGFAIFQSTLWAIIPDWKTSLTLLLYSAVLPIVMLLNIRSTKTIQAAFFIVAVTCLLLVLLGFYRYVTGEGGIPSEHALNYWGIHYAPATRNSDVLYAGVGMCIASSFMLFGPRKFNWLKLGAGIAAFIFGVAVFMSLSRGALVTTGISVVVLGQRYFKKKSGLFVFSAFIALMLVILGFSQTASFSLLTERFGTLGSDELEGSDANSMLARLVVQSNAFQRIIWTERFFLGVGIGNFSQYVSLNETTVNHAENAYISLWAETGIIGFIAYVLAMVYPIRVLWRIDSEWQEPDTLWVFLAALVIPIGWALNFLVTTEYYGVFHWEIVSLSAAAALIAQRQAQATSAQKLPLPLPDMANRKRVVIGNHD